MPVSSPKQRCALTAPFHPYLPKKAVRSLWRFPSSPSLLKNLAGRYPAPCLYGARTFLEDLAAPAIVQPPDEKDVMVSIAQVKA